MNERFSRTEELLGTRTMELISSRKVLIAGIGGVGSWCAEALARTGFRNITLVDGDCIDITNINRQAPAVQSTIGLPKTRAMRNRLLDINPEANITALPLRFSAETLDAFNLSACDIVIDAIDSVRDKALLINTALDTARVRLFSSMGAALRFDPSRVKSSPFKKVTGDGLAKALRAQFKKTGSPVNRDFICVWSDEPPAEIKIRASLMPATAAFGLKLAALAVDACRADAEQN